MSRIQNSGFKCREMAELLSHVDRFRHHRVVIASEQLLYAQDARQIDATGEHPVETVCLSMIPINGVNEQSMRLRFCPSLLVSSAYYRYNCSDAITTR